MKDINTPLQKAYYDAISALSIPVFEGEEPNNTNEPIYVVLHDINSTEASNKYSFAFNASIQVSIHSIKSNVNNSVDINEKAGLILDAIKPEAISSLLADGILIVTTNISVDRQTRSKIGDTAFITRDIIFNHLIHYN